MHGLYPQFGRWSGSQAMDGEEKASKAEAVDDVGRDWSEMTPVCLVNVFARLGLEDRWKGAMLVCKSWLEASRDPSLFEALDLDPSFEAAGSGRPDVAFWWTPEFERRVDSMLRRVAECGAERVREVRVRHCSDRSLALVAESCPYLQVLSISSSPRITDASLSKIASACPLLKELDISNCYEVSYKSLELIGSKCSKLTILKRNLLNWLDPSQHTGIVPADYMNACPQDGDREATAIANFMPNLKHVELRFLKLSVKGLIILSERCRGLEYLDLVGCANLTDRAIEQASANLKDLKTLKKLNFYIPRSVFHTERYGHWRLYDERFQTNIFQI